MRNLSGNQIREDFLRFFEGKQHRRVHSSSLVPVNDPTLLFTNAGMNQFKDVFLGAEKRDYTRATTSQKCVRAGGKHNDLENVGFTRRHHTFFEMLGNFSFGDYFKRDAIAYAWEFLTSKDWCGIDASKLYVTIFEGSGTIGRDTEAEEYWIEVGIQPDRIFGMGAKDNFWQMGDTGPCGPCSEIFYDLGITASETGENKPFPNDDQRYVEVWNLVFMQFDRMFTGDFSLSPDGYALTPLPRASIDTGMGLERISAVLQGKLSNYESDLFTPLLKRAVELTWNLNNFQLPDAAEIDKLALSDHKGAASLRIIADHARAATFLISDGIVPANEGRGYVLRKILRRGIRHGRLLGQEQPFMHEMVFAVRDEMKTAYPELNELAERVAKVVLGEEKQFERVLRTGMLRLDAEIQDAKLQLKNFGTFDEASFAYLQTVDIEQTRSEYESALKALKIFFEDEEITLHEAMESRDATLFRFREFMNQKYAHATQDKYVSVSRQFILSVAGNKSHVISLSGASAFKLYETFGMPLDFMVDAARDAGIEFDMAGFEAAKEEEQQRARASWKGGSQKSAAPVYRELPPTQFEGYSATRLDGAKVLALVKDGLGVSELKTGEAGEVVLDATSFYADSGGQVGDVGWLYASDHITAVAEVSGCKKPVQGVFSHQVVAKHTIAVGDTLDAVVNAGVRHATIRNHTGTHLLHAALRQVLGTHVKQAGSLNNSQRLRFDFSHFTGVAEEELAEIEDIVNTQVLANTAVNTMVDVPIDVAVHELGAMALFGEKYGERVRVVKIGDFSTELCGGIHTTATGEIGLIKLVGEGAVASGVRRVEAVTGTGALSLFRRDAEVAKVASMIVGSGETNAAALQAKLAQQDDEVKKLRRELEQMRMKSASAATADAASNAVEVKGVKLLAQRVDALDKSQMRNLVDELRGKLGSGVVVLGAATTEGKVSLIAGVTKDLTSRLQAGKIVGALAVKVGGKGGGRPDLAEAGGSDVSALDATLADAASVLAAMLG